MKNESKQGINFHKTLLQDQTLEHGMDEVSQTQTAFEFDNTIIDLQGTYTLLQHLRLVKYEKRLIVHRNTAVNLVLQLLNL